MSCWGLKENAASKNKSLTSFIKTALAFLWQNQKLLQYLHGTILPEKLEWSNILFHFIR